MAENNNENVQEVQLSKEELNELIKVRKEKLLAMQEAGNDPFQIVKYPVDTHTDEIRDRYDELEGKEVTIAGRILPATTPRKVPKAQPAQGVRIRPNIYHLLTLPFCPEATAKTSSVLTKATRRRSVSRNFSSSFWDREMDINA